MLVRKVSILLILLSVVFFLSGVETGCSQKKTDVGRPSTLVAGGKLAIPANTDSRVRLVVSTPEPGFSDIERQLASKTLERIRTRLQPILERPLEVEYDKRFDMFTVSSKDRILIYLHTPHQQDNRLRLRVSTQGLLQKKAENIVQEEMRTFAEVLHANELYIDEDK